MPSADSWRRPVHGSRICHSIAWPTPLHPTRLSFCGSRLVMKFFSRNSGIPTVFGAPGGGNCGVDVDGGAATTGAGAGGGGGVGAAFSVIDNSGAEVPARQLISLSKVMNFSCEKRTR